MNSSEDLKKSPFNFSFVIIYTIHNVLVLMKKYLNDLKDNILECFFKKCDRRLFFFKKFFITYNDKKSMAQGSL